MMVVVAAVAAVASVSEVEEMARAVCNAVRRRHVAFDDNTWTGYGDLVKD
jgi:hypothetical protein